MKDIVCRIGRYIIKGVPTIIVKPNIVELPISKLLDNRTAIITGASSRIGFEIAKAFLKAGASVVITGRSKEKLGSAKNRLMACGGVKYIHLFWIVEMLIQRKLFLIR